MDDMIPNEISGGYRTIRIAKVVTGPDLDEMFGNEEEKMIVPEQKIEEPIKDRSLDDTLVFLDEHPDQEKRSMDDSIEYWNRVGDGRIMASMPDYYQAFKQLSHDLIYGSVQERDKVKRMISTLRDSFDWGEKKKAVLSSTMVIYGTTTKDAKMIHHYDCTDTSKIKSIKIGIPAFTHARLEEVLNMPEGLKYIQSLLGTEDDAEKIRLVLSFISDISDITVFTESDSLLQHHAKIMAGFYCENNRFHVDLFNSNISYCSFGVKIMSTPSTR